MTYPRMMSLLLAVSLCACSSGEEDQPEVSCTAPEGEAFAVGTGELCYEPLTDGATVSIIGGPQGGYHIWLSLACEACEGATLVSYGVRDADGNWLSGNAQQEMVEIDQAQAAGITAFIPEYDMSAGPNEFGEYDYIDPSSYIGQQLTLSASIERDGQLFEDEVAVTISGIEYQSSGCPECN